MAGWILVLNAREEARQLEARLNRVFNVPGVTELRIRTIHPAPEHTLLQWAWDQPVESDLAVAITPDQNVFAMVDGYVVACGTGASPVDRPLESQVLQHLATEDEDAIVQINGSFACVRLDTRNRQVSVWTDRIASRPVWIARTGSTWYVGNYPAAIASVMPHVPRLNPAGLWSLFLSSRHVGPQGLYDGFRNLPGGSCARIDYDADRARIQFSRWHENVFRPENGRTPGEWGEAIAAELKAAAQRLLRHSPSPRLFLSGGLDSRLVLGAIGNEATGVTLSSTPNNMNVRLARRAAKLIGARHEAINRTPNWYLERFESAALLAGGNYNLAHAHFLIPVQSIQATNPGATFLLGDLMENFNKHYFTSSDLGNHRFVPGEIPRIYEQLYSYTHRDRIRLRRLFQDGVADRLSTDWKDAMTQLCNNVRLVSDDDRDCFDALFRWYDCSLCPTYLMSECIRPHGRERNLMFDNSMIDLLHRIPADIRGAGVLHPWTLWHLNKGLALLPDSNFWVPPISPKAVKKITRAVRPTLGRLRRGVQKMANAAEVATATEGSWHMLDTRFREDSAHRAFIESVVQDPECFPSELFRRDEIRSAWQGFLNGDGSRDRSFEISMLLSFGLLHRALPSSGSAW